MGIYLGTEPCLIFRTTLSSNSLHLSPNYCKIERPLKKGGIMENKGVKIVNAILFGVGILLFLAAGFDLLPAQDNLLVFLGIACFIIVSVIKKISKSSCSK